MISFQALGIPVAPGSLTSNVLAQGREASLLA